MTTFASGDGCDSSDPDSGAGMLQAFREKQQVHNTITVRKVGRRRGNFMAGVPLRTFEKGAEWSEPHLSVRPTDPAPYIRVGHDKPSFAVIQGLFADLS